MKNEKGKELFFAFFVFPAKEIKKKLVSGDTDCGENTRYLVDGNLSFVGHSS